jgi:hypothetical protein
MSSRTVMSTSCNGEIASATGIFKAGSVRWLRIWSKEATAYADNATTEFISREGSSAGMPGEMPQMVTVRPNTGAVRH